jgi:uncharacterized protein
MSDLVIWRGLEEWQVEACSMDLGGDGIVASGTQIGSDPVAYRLDYRLDAGDGFVTRALEVTAVGRGWRRTLDLRSDGRGTWTCVAEADGELDLPAPGGDAASLAGALDCDLGRSPLTNLMPIRRSGLDRRPGAADFLMAWVSVPDLSVVAYRQRYEHVRDAVVRYVDLGAFEGFTAELELDGAGVVERYPELAERVGDEPSEP